tara:strand:+ start:1459 stop:2127 length:669 start_codon:yes stop_codon:yes gene_type:complete
MSKFESPKGIPSQAWFNKQSYETLSTIAEMLWRTHTISVKWHELEEDEITERCESWGIEPGKNIWHSRNRLRKANDEEEEYDEDDDDEEDDEEHEEDEQHDEEDEDVEQHDKEPEEPKQPKQPEQRTALMRLTLKELKEEGKRLRIKNYSTMNKATLFKAIEDYWGVEEDESSSSDEEMDYDLPPIQTDPEEGQKMYDELVQMMELNQGPDSLAEKVEKLKV